MGILISGLPQAIEIDDVIYDINTDYQTCLRIIMAFEDNNLAAFEKINILINLLYKETPHDFEQAYLKGIKFLDCGGSHEDKDSCKIESARLYSFEHDEKYIFSGVDKVLNGRLSKGDHVHWWEFVMAFMELPEDCTMSRILYFRTQHSKGKLTKDEMRVWNENRELFELPESLSYEEEQAKNKFMELLKNNSLS